MKKTRPFLLSGPDSCRVKPGRILFEMDGVTKEVAFEAMRLAKHKLSIQTKLIAKEEL